MKFSRVLFSIEFIILMTGLSSCRHGSPVISLSPTVNSPVPTVYVPSETATTLGPSMPTQYLEFASLDDLLKTARFQIMVPTSIPDNLPFSKAWTTDYANGDQNIRLLYSEPGNALDANIKLIDIQMKMTAELVTKETIAAQFKIAPLDLQGVEVRGQTGFTYWTQSGAAGNSASLTWREVNINFTISLFGNWPAPDNSNPHGLDNLLITIANSLQIMKQ